MLVCWGGITLCSWKQARNNWKTSKIVGFERKKKMLQWSPLWIVFKGKNKNGSSLARTISASRGSFFANLITFERRSGLKNLCLRKIAILKMGCCFEFVQSHRSWGDTHFDWGAAQAPPNQIGIDLRLIKFLKHPIFKINKWLFLLVFLFLLLFLSIFGNIFCNVQSTLLIANLWGQVLVSDLRKISNFSWFVCLSVSSNLVWNRTT